MIDTFILYFGRDEDASISNVMFSYVGDVKFKSKIDAFYSLSEDLYANFIDKNEYINSFRSELSKCCTKKTNKGFKYCPTCGTNLLGEVENRPTDVDFIEHLTNLLAFQAHSYGEEGSWTPFELERSAVSLKKGSFAIIKEAEVMICAAIIKKHPKYLEDLETWDYEKKIKELEKAWSFKHPRLLVKGNEE